MQAVLANASCPVVVDADGINVLEGHIDVLRGAACPVVLTPHDGEYRRLMGRLPGEDLQGAAAALAEKTGATVLLKGHRTAICGADERWENRCGNPGLATGGSGDVLAGILVSLLGQGLPPRACSGCGCVAPRNGGRPLRRPDGGVRPAALGRCGGAAIFIAIGGDARAARLRRTDDVPLPAARRLRRKKPGRFALPSRSAPRWCRPGDAASARS